MPHTIRLRGPWEYQPLGRAEILADGQVSIQAWDLPGGGTLALPADWGEALGRDFRGLVRFTRRFAQPTGLDARSRVWLVIEEVDRQGNVTLNGTSLGIVWTSATTPVPGVGAQLCPARLEITNLLQPRNVLTIDVVKPPLAAGVPPEVLGPRTDLPGGLIGLVRLEIQSN